MSFRIIPPEFRAVKKDYANIEDPECANIGDAPLHKSINSDLMAFNY